MCLKNMRNRETCFARHIDVNIAVRSRIENRGDAFVIISDKIRKLGDAFGLNGFENERHRWDLTRSANEVQLQFWQRRGASLCSRGKKTSTHLDRDRQQMIYHVRAAIGIALHRLRSAV